MLWNFNFTPYQNKTLVSTETRITCTDKASCIKFGIYWFFVRPFSGSVEKKYLGFSKRALNSKIAVK